MILLYWWDAFAYRKLFMISKKNIDFFFSTLARMYPDDATELVRETPWQLLIAVVMSAQTTDKQVNKVTAKFFPTIKSPYDTLKLTREEWSTYISWVNYAPTKAKNLSKTAQLLITNHHTRLATIDDESKRKKVYTKERYSIPATIKELMTLAGVGEKTAKVVAHILYEAAVIAVDTHVHRVSNRISLVSTKLPLQTSRVLDTVIPEQHKQTAHHSMVMFGRYHCTARKPKCDSCPFTSFCIYYKKQHD